MVKAYRQDKPSYQPIVIILETQKEYDHVVRILGDIKPNDARLIYKDYDESLAYEIYCVITDAHEKGMDC